MQAKALAAVARRLNREAGSPSIPALYFLTDPTRTPDPLAVVRTLPRSVHVIYRHFGQIGLNPVALARLCRARGLQLSIAADPDLAADLGAGLHWPERLLKTARPFKGFVTASAHTAAGLRRATAFGVDACLLAPVFPTRSSSGNRPLGLIRAGQLARGASIPVIALGGVNAGNAHKLSRRGFAGVAAIDAFLGA